MKLDLIQIALLFGSIGTTSVSSFSLIGLNNKGSFISTTSTSLHSSRSRNSRGRRRTKVKERQIRNKEHHDHQHQSQKRHNDNTLDINLNDLSSSPIVNRIKHLNHQEYIDHDNHDHKLHHHYHHTSHNTIINQNHDHNHHHTTIPIEELSHQQQQHQHNNNPVSVAAQAILSRIIPHNLQFNHKTPPNLVSDTNEWKKLQRHAERIDNIHVKELLKQTKRCNKFCIEHDGIYFDYSRQRVTMDTMSLLQDLATRQNLKEKINDMVTGKKINKTENRAVLHTALRSDYETQKGTIHVDGQDVVEDVHEVLQQIKSFTNHVRSGTIRGYTGKRLRNIVSVGIGGSYLGPEFLNECLKTEPEGINTALGYSLRFLSNVDPVDVERTCADLDPEETLIVIISKTFTTAETMLNARTMRQWLWDFMGNDKEVVRKHVVACASVSSSDKVKEFGIDVDKYFFNFWDWVGGRYSLCSAVGAVPISLLYGYDLFEKFLKGARSVDEHFLSAPFERNIPVIMGLLGVWNMSFMGYNTRTILPYAEALLKFPAHIQQLDMESNGKHCTNDGYEINYPVGEIDFGEPGTNGQHSFYQLLHMGQTVPCEFIGFIQSQHDLCVDGEHLSSHDELMANFFAQPDALANGKTPAEVRAEGTPEDLVVHKTFYGNRPSLSLLFPRLTAYATGQLLALYEHRTAVQGFIWDINSFDQWGVELGKKLAVDIKDVLMDARKQISKNGDDDIQIKIPKNPATSRIMSHYINQSRNTTCDNIINTNPITTVTRNTFMDHGRQPPPTSNDLRGNRGKLS